jgi:hypothetical protein
MSHAPPSGYHSCPTCGTALEPGAIVCSGCDMPLPAPHGLPHRIPWYIKALAVAALLYLGFVAWYAITQELVEARESQMRQDVRAERYAAPRSGPAPR